MNDFKKIDCDDFKLYELIWITTRGYKHYDYQPCCSKAYAGELAARLQPNRSHADAQFYADGPTAVAMGTSHVSVIGPDDEMIAITV